MDWEEIRNEYVTTKTSYRKLAEKYGVSFNVLMKKGAAEKWKDIRQKTCRKMAEKTQEKIIEKTAEIQSDNMVAVSRISEKLINKVLKNIDSIPIDTARDLRACIQSICDINSQFAKKENDAGDVLHNIAEFVEKQLK